MPATMYIFYPVFYDLKLISTLMYFEKRFHRSVRLVAAVVFLFGMVMFLPVIIYIPGLAFNQGILLCSLLWFNHFFMYFMPFAECALSSMSCASHAHPQFVHTAFRIRPSIVLYIVFSLALSTIPLVSGVNVHIVTSIMCIVCVFYTSIGGLRYVYWHLK